MSQHNSKDRYCADLPLELSVLDSAADKSAGCVCVGGPVWTLYASCQVADDDACERLPPAAQVTR